MATFHAVVASAADRPGLLFQLTKVFADHDANITLVDIHAGTDVSKIYFEFTLPDTPVAPVFSDLRAVPGVHAIDETPPFAKIYGKRIIVMGGGAQVGFVAMGAIAEADRHNIRGERISIDTIPLVGEKELAAAVRAVMHLPRNGLYVISLNMAGSVPDAADLVVSDPVQAGVMAVMAVADTAKFDLMRQLKRRY
jgi:energy-converting hydrogenase B subunit Q